MTATLPAGIKRRITTDTDGAYTVSLYARKRHLGSYRFTGYGPGPGPRWTVGVARYDTEAEALDALLKEIAA